ncbi:MAG: hypothetical protein ACLPVJ_16740 [Syntrophobacteraceae bacterium]
MMPIVILRHGGALHKASRSRPVSRVGERAVENERSAPGLIYAAPSVGRSLDIGAGYPDDRYSFAGWSF